MEIKTKTFNLAYGVIHKGCPHLGGDKGLATMWTKVDWGREGGSLAVSRQPLQCGLCKREGGIQRSFIIIFLH